MNLLTRWNPNPTTRWEPFEEFERGLARFFGSGRGNGDEPLSATAWQPLTDIIEDDKEFLVKVELPEVKKENVKVTLEDGVLPICGERKFEKEEGNKTYHRTERSYGSFMRAFTLPEGADEGHIAADFKDGVLMVHLPKTDRAMAKTKTINVKVA